MIDRLNIRVLDPTIPGLLEQEVRQLERYAEAWPHVLGKAHWHVLHVGALPAHEAMIVKQLLTAYGGDALIATDAYLGQQQETGALLFGTARSFHSLQRALRAMPLPVLPALGEALAAALAALQRTPPTLRLGASQLSWGQRTYVMGIINVTPDSFSGDGLLGEADLLAQVREQAGRFADEGADLLDIGGESSRPGAAEVSAEEELRRVVPAIRAASEACALPISVDTWKAEVAEAALDAGAGLINDIWGLRTPDGGWNEALALLVARRGVPLALMHNRRAQAARTALGGHYASVHYADLLGEICADLRESLAFAERCGIASEQLIVDPGIGFGKTPAQNLEVLRRLGELRSLGRPILLGTSRKSFIGLALNLPPEQRGPGTAATTALGIAAGADIVRVHDVALNVQVARMSDVLVRQAPPAPSI